MKPLRVCFLIQGMSDGGAQKQCIYLLNELQGREDIELHLIYFFPGVHDHLLNKSHLKITRLTVRSNYDLTNVFRLRRTLKAIQPDILLSWLHACDVYSFFVRRCVSDLLWLMTERDSHYPPDPRYWLRRQLGRHADAIIANSAKGDAYWRESGARGSLFVVPNIVLTPPCPTPVPRTRSAIYIGRLEPQKNVATVVRAFCLLAARRPDLSFSIFGDGSLRSDLETIVRDARQNERITFLGFQSDMTPNISRAAVVVSMSHHEGLPNVMLESTAAGTPIVASDIPEHRELLGADYPFYVKDRNNPGDCADAIELALSPGDHAAALSFANARISRMTPGAVGDMYMNIFRAMRREL